MEQGTSFATLDLDGEDRFQRLRAELGVSTFGINLIRLRAGQQGRVHSHQRQEEVYLVLEGTLTLELDGGESRELARGDAARVGPGVKRRLANLHEAPAIVLALGGANEHEGRDGRAWESWEEGGDGRSPQDVPLPADRSV
jgi:quercetin dioxygenase-like cupin family protein